MNAERLLAHYEKIVDAPNAISRLRRFVLDLAVRGKLVPQDASDEPASELLKRIAKEKARLVEAGELRKPRDLDGGNDLDGPFSIPATWKWVRLDAIGAIVGGGTPSATDTDNFAEPGAGVPWLTPADLGSQSELYISRGSRDLSQKGSRASSATVMPKGTVLFTSRAPIGYVAIAANPISTNQGFKSIVPYILECSRFVATAMKAFAPEIDARAPGTTFKEVSSKIVAGISFPLPPLAEQHRIVAKVDELIGLCDQLDVARADREATRDRLAAASLARLNAPDPETFPADVRFARDALLALTTRPDQLKAFHETILNLAVRGKLVPQDPADKPASDVGLKIKNRSRGQVQESIDPPFALPVGWAWRAIDTLADQVTDGEHATPPRISETQVPLVTAKNVREGFMDYSHTDWVSLETAQKAWGRCRPQVGDLLLVCVGATTGRLTVLREPRDMVLVRSVALIRPSSDVLGEYLERTIRSPVLQQQIWASVKAAAQPCLYINRIQSLLVPLPPLAEQRRIVAKVDALMALCDRLEASLTATAATRRRLLDALLAEALAPADAREMEAAE
jgi:type I restriction enzyme, S subunit